MCLIKKHMYLFFFTFESIFRQSISTSQAGIAIHAGIIFVVIQTANKPTRQPHAAHFAHLYPHATASYCRFFPSA
jgi:hypothetical protein